MTTEKSDNFDDCPMPDLDEWYRKGLEVWERKFRTSENPVYVWQAIWWSADCAVTRALASGADTAEASAATLLPLPPWVLQYLANAARELLFLNQGLDSRTRAPHALIGNRDAEADGNWRGNPTFDFDQALSRVPNALGLVRQGWNAFRDHKARRATQGDLDALMQHRIAGRTMRQATERLMDELGLQNDRSVRRRIRKARREIGPNFPPKSGPDKT
jgi:hypothetical protein